MLVWVMRRRMEISPSKLCLSLRLRRAVLISLIATASPVTLCCAFQTTAKEPWPIWWLNT